MADASTLSSAMDAAAAAAATSDFRGAEQHLKRAVELQEATLGRQHPDVANTLNNLGVVYEHLEQPAEAERCYRRAYAIARAALPATDPSVALSERNLRDFCEARGIPFDPPAPPAPPPVPASPPPVARAVTAAAVQAPAAPPPRQASQSPTPTPPIAAGARSVPPGPMPRPASAVAAAPAPDPHGSTKSSRPISVAAIIGLAVIVGLVMFFHRARPATRTTAPEDAAQARQPVPAPQAAAPPSTPAPSPEPAAPVATENPSPTSSSVAPPSPIRKASPAPAPDAPSSGRAPAASAATPTVVTAQVCRALEIAAQWQCTPVTEALEPGPVFFYTRLKCPTDTTVQHRWYLNDRVRQTMTLHVRANQNSGYRTYSRTTVGASGAGDWRVELRAMDGTVLHTERFTVARP